MQGIPLSLNLYTYGFNNPIRYTDPSGHFPGIAIVGLVLVGVAIVGSFTGCQDKKSTESSSSTTHISSSGGIHGGGGRISNRETVDPIESDTSSQVTTVPETTTQAPVTTTTPQDKISSAEEQLLKSSPNALTYYADPKSTYSGESDASVIARMLYGEDVNSMEAHLWMLENRKNAGGYGGTDFRGLILAKNQFSTMWEERSLNPASKFHESGGIGKNNWDACVDIAYQYLNGGIESISKPSENFNYTWTYAYSDSTAETYPDGVKIGGTWFYNK